MSLIQEFRKRVNPRHTFSNPCCLTSMLLDNRDRCLAIISDKDERRKETKDGWGWLVPEEPPPPHPRVKVIKTANQSERKYYKQPMRYQIRKSQPFRPLPPPDLSERWREFSRPITGCEGKPV